MMIQFQPIQVYVIPCRWCNHYVFPRIVGTKIEYPDACTNRTCRRATWNKSDSEIRRIRKYQNSHLIQAKRVKQKPIQKSFICNLCDILYEDSDSLNRHNMRRHER